MNFRELQRCINELELPYDVELRVECWSDPVVQQGLYIIEENALYLGDDLSNLYETIAEDYLTMGLQPPAVKWFNRKAE